MCLLTAVVAAAVLAPVATAELSGAAEITVVSCSTEQIIPTSQYSPSSPDPSGIVYLAGEDRFIVSDSEVDEMTIYQGKNLFSATRTGSGVGTGTTWPPTREPAGVGFNPANNTLFVADDDRDSVYLFRPGPDGVHGTADDVVTSFSTAAFGSLDPEDVTYDTDTGHLYVSDGVTATLYRIDPVNGTFGDAGDVITTIDVAQYGARDAEGVGMDPRVGHVVVVDPSTKSLYELTKSGDIVRIIDCRGIPTTNKLLAGVTLAPTSDANDDPAKLSYWVVDRQVDNGTDPNENDGLLYELTVPVDDGAPTVSITAPTQSAVSQTVVLQAAATGATEVAFAVDGTAIGTDTNGADGWTATWDTTSTTDGSHIVTATATGAGGSSNASRSYIVDNTSPSVAVSAPEAGATVSGTVPVSATASDNNAVASVEFRVDGESIGTDTNGTDGWSSSWNTTAESDGAHDVAAVALDTAGNAATSAPVQVTVSNENLSAANVSITVGADDADELAGTGAVRRSNGDLELGSDQTTPTTVGLRFRGVPVPQGATIVGAYVQFQVDEANRAAAALTVRAENVDNSAGFTTTAFNISSRPRTSAFVDWAPPIWTGIGAAGADQRTPDFRSVAQEVVNRPGWVAGNALTIIVTGSGRRTAESFEGGAPPILHLEYQTGPPVAPANSAAPSISGTASVGATLTADPGTWTGSQPISYAYQWRRCDAGGGGCADITGATNQTYKPVDDDAGSTLRANVTATNTVGSASATSSQTAAVQGVPADGLLQVADSLTGSGQPTYYSTNHRLAVTEGGRVLAVFGKHLAGVQLAWRDPGRSWRTATRGQVSDGLVLGGTGTGDWGASIAVERDPAGAEHAWVVWGAATTGGSSKPVQIRRLSGLDDPAGPSVGPIVTIAPSSANPNRPDIAFEKAADGSTRACLAWTELLPGTNKYRLVAGWVTNLATDTPGLEGKTTLFSNANVNRNSTLAPGPGVMTVVARAGSDRLRAFRHDAAAALTSWSTSLAGASTKAASMPSAVVLTSGDVLAALETDPGANAVTVQRFTPAGTASVDLQLTGYANPSVATDGDRAWLVMIRASDGYVVSRSFSSASGWSQSDRVEIGAEGGGNYAWPNVLRQTDGRLRFIVRGPAGASKQAAVLAFQRLL